MHKTALAVTAIALCLAPSSQPTVLLPTTGGRLSAQDKIGGEKKKIVIEWAKKETKNYAIDYESAVPSDVVQKIGSELEDILEQYVKLFKHRPKEKLKVRLMDSQNTYEQVGGDPRMAGFYNPGSGYLYIKNMPFYDLIPIVYHEAFHQYVQDFVGKVHVPIWFNEGMAKYFENMTRDKNKKGKPLNPKKIKRGSMRMVKDAVKTRRSIPLEKLLDVTHEEFHDKDNEALYYSQSFALVFWLMERTKGRMALTFMKELKKKKDPEAGNAKFFGKKRKGLKKMEAQWKAYMRKVDTKGIGIK